MADDLQQNREINAGGRVKAFLESDDWREAKERVLRDLDDDFDKASTNDMRTAVWARRRALKDIEAKLTGTVNRGERAVTEKAMNERAGRR